MGCDGMAKKLHKTNAMRELETMSISYRTAQYTVDPDNLTGVHVAEELGEDPDSIFKTLVLEGERTGHLVCCLPSDFELDLKKVARVAGDKKVELIPMKDLLPTTGYVRGGCSPLGMKKFPTYIDETAQLFDEIAVSAGERGEQIILNPFDLQRASDATFADLTT